MAREQYSPKKAKSDEDILELARERMRICIDDYEEERRKQRDDLLFSTLEQWPSDVRSQREGDPNGPRPCLTIDQINQYIVQVVNDMKQNRPAIKIRPYDDYSDPETAEVLQGVIRHIENNSQAQVAYSTAAESAVRVGEGYFRIITEYENERSFNQKICFRRIPDMFSCYLGHHIMPDGSDAEYAFVFEDILLEKFKRLYPGKRFDKTDFDELGEGQAYWNSEGHIRVSEYFYYEYTNTELLFLADGRTVTEEEYDGTSEITGRRKTRLKSVKWCKHTGLEILEKQDWPGKFLPIVKVIGKEGWVDGKRCNWGLVRPAKDSLRMYNYWASTITEKIALAPKAPYIGAKGQFEGFEDRWQNANRVNYAYLEYNPTTAEGGVVLPAPLRTPPVPMEVAMVQQLQTIREDVQASLGMFKASLGKEQPQQSGKAILALTQESDTGVFHFADNMALSIQCAGRILVDLIPKIYDTKRIMKILGEDGKIAEAQIDPSMPVARTQIADAVGKIKRIYNLGVGQYDVTATVGPSYNTKRMEAATLFTDLSNSAKDPISAAIVRYLAIKNSDFNGAEEAAEMLEKLLPPGIVPQEGQPPIPPQVAQQMMQMKQMLQQMGQELQKAKSGENAKLAAVAADQKEAFAKLEWQKQLDAEESQRKWAIAQDDAERDQWIAEQKAKVQAFEAGQDAEIEKRKVDLDEETTRRELSLKENESKESMRLEREKAENDMIPEEQRKAIMEGKAVETYAKPFEEKITKALEGVENQLKLFKEEIPEEKPQVAVLDAVRGKGGEMTSVRVTRADGTSYEVKTRLH